MTHAVAVGRDARSWSRWWPWLRWVAVAAIIAALVSLLGTRAFAAGLNVLTPTAVLAALAIGLLTTVLNALRWRFVARRVGLQLRLGDAIAETYRAIFLNAVLPGGVLGDVDRAVRHGRTSGDVGRGARAVAIERTAGQLVLIAAAVVVIPAEPALVVEIVSRAGRAPLLGAALVVALAAVVAVLVVRSRRAARSGRWRQLLGDTAADVRAGVLSRSAWPLLIVLSAAALGGYLVLFLVAARSAGATASTLALLPPLLLALIAMGLPISVGGWGPREGVAALSFWMAGLGAPLGVTTSVAYGALALIASLPGAAVLLARRLARSRQPSRRRSGHAAGLAAGAESEAPTGPIAIPLHRLRPPNQLPPPPSRPWPHTVPNQPEEPAPLNLPNQPNEPAPRNQSDELNPLNRPVPPNTPSPLHSRGPVEAPDPVPPIELPRQRRARHRRPAGAPTPTGPHDSAADRPILPTGLARVRRRPIGHTETT